MIDIINIVNTETVTTDYYVVKIKSSLLLEKTKSEEMEYTRLS